MSHTSHTATRGGPAGGLLRVDDVGSTSSGTQRCAPLSSAACAVSALSRVDLGEDKTSKTSKTGDWARDGLYRRTVDAAEHAVLNLSPAFFSLNMGTGITSILLYTFPFQAAWLRHVGVVVFVLNVALFVLILGGNAVRFVRWKGLFAATLKHPVSGLFWGTLPMGLVTIVNMIAYTLVSSAGVGVGWARLVVGLWWMDVILSVIVNLGMIFLMFTRQTHTAESMSAAWLLPIVSCVVAAASGGIVATSLLARLPELPELARSIVIVSYVVWGTGVPLALFVIAVYVHRTVVYGVPAAGGAGAGMGLPSVFLPLGPCGQGSFGIVVLGRAVRALAYENGVGLGIVPAAAAGDAGGAGGAGGAAAVLRMADAVYAGGLVTGLVLWGLGFCWYVLATAMFVDHVWTQDRGYMGPKSFTIGFTALTFPIGVWATATTALATELDSPALKMIGAVVSVQVIVNWMYVMAMAVYQTRDGSLFVAPELALFPDKTPALRFGGGGRQGGGVQRWAV